MKPTRAAAPRSGSPSRHLCGGPHKISNATQVQDSGASAAEPEVPAPFTGLLLFLVDRPGAVPGKGQGRLVGVAAHPNAEPGPSAGGEANREVRPVDGDLLAVHL